MIPVRIRYRLRKLLGGAMVRISEFGSEDVGSNPAPITNVGFSLPGKAPHCGCGEQGSSPGVNQQYWLIVQRIERFATNEVIQVRFLLSQQVHCTKLTRSSTVRAGTLYVQGYRFESGRVNTNTLLQKLVRNSIGSEYRSFTPGVQGSSPCGPTTDE